MPRPAHPNPAGQPAGSEPIDLVAGDPPVPITVWRTPAGGSQASISPRLADRLIIAYSRPGEVVVDLTDDHALTNAAAQGGRRHHPGWFTDGSALIVGPPSATAAPDSAPPARPAGRRRRPGEDADPPGIAAWFGDDLTDPHLPPTGATAPGPDTTTVQGATSLLVAGWPLHRTSGGNRRRLRWLLRGAVALLRPGGCLVLVVRGAPGAARPAAPKDHGPLVDAAQAAGLGYLQHIVAVRADTDADQFTYYATEQELAAMAGETAVAHLPVHADLLVLTPRATTVPAAAGDGRE